MDGAVEVIPDQGVVLHVSGQETYGQQGQHYNIIQLPVLDVVLLRDVAGGEVADPVHGHDADILDGAQQVLDRDTLITEDDICHTP